MITIEEFLKVELRVGIVLEASDVEGSEKLIKQIVDFGDLGKRQILSGIKQWYKPAQLIGKQFVYVVNLEPRMMMGLESQGMILAAEGDNPSTSSGHRKPIPIKPSGKVPAGAKLHKLR
jgi:methionine--tRNA ligase beta chain